MKKVLFLFLILFYTGIILIAQSGIKSAVSKKIDGVLRVSEINPRYFTDNSGKAVYLTGSHTWANFQEHYTDKDSVIFDWNGYLDMMQDHGHNFMRFWMYEQPEGQAWTLDKAYVSPMCYARTGKEMAHDGKPKFDLDQWNEEYFKRMRSRIIEAGNRGIYASVMLFQGWSLNKLAVPESDPFLSHPYNKLNNINGIDVINTINDQADKPTLHSMGNKAALLHSAIGVRCPMFDVFP